MQIQSSCKGATEQPTSRDTTSPEVPPAEYGVSPPRSTIADAGDAIETTEWSPTCIVLMKVTATMALLWI